MDVFATDREKRQKQVIIQKQIDKVKRQTGLSEPLNPDFREFFLNWKAMGENAFIAPNRKPRLRWLVRRLREAMAEQGVRV